MYRSDRIPLRRPPTIGGTIEIRVSPRGDEASPRLLMGERGAASSPHVGMRCHLVLPRGD
ncbi:hypothetical protein BHM03_00017748, partial [Ensete ventricosum]